MTYNKPQIINNMVNCAVNKQGTSVWFRSMSAIFFNVYFNYKFVHRNSFTSNKQFNTYKNNDTDYKSTLHVVFVEAM